jgi:hypothetical protein
LLPTLAFFLLPLSIVDAEPGKLTTVLVQDFEKSASLPKV